MKALLIRPPQSVPNLDFPAGPRVGLPLGLLYVAAATRSHGYEVEIYDALAAVDTEKIDRTSGWMHFGADWDRIKTAIRSSQAHVIGISNPFSTQLNATLRVAALAKDALPEATIVVGGPHASVSPETFFEDSKDIDLVCQGEGEIVFPNLLRVAEGREEIENVDGIVYRDRDGVKRSGSVSFIEDLDDLPLPAYDLVPLERYFELERLGYSPRVTFDYPGSDRSLSIITSRGCPFNCVFCSIHPHMGNRWRAHSAEYVLDHLRHVRTKFGVRHIHFEDDNLTLDSERFEAILDGLSNENAGLTWDTPNGVRADTFDDPLLVKAKETGCTYLVLGIESGDQESLDRFVQKKLDLKKSREVAAKCKQIGLDLHAFFIIGFPGESETNIRNTLDFALDLRRSFNVFPHVNLAYPQYGTELYRICEERGYLTAPSSPQTFSTWRGDKQERQMIETDQFKVADLYRLSNTFHRKLAAQSGWHSVVFLARNPKVAAFVISAFLRKMSGNPLRFKRALKNVYSRYLLFENYLKRVVVAGSSRSRTL
ncbi:MAG: B12-binding domain-containing radical SAM protein [Terriglobia bacterium]